ncbi:MAG: choice-of-anchor B family protein, partial [Bacteroidota bacterium]
MRTHNIFIDTQAGRLYAAGSDAQNNGVIILDLATNPANPPLLARVDLGQYTHDIYVRSDTGYMSNAYSGLRIVDFTNPTNPALIGQLSTYPQQGYNHSSWLTPDGNHLVMADETHNRSLKMVDVSNLGNLSVSSLFRSALLGPQDTASIPHNPFIAGKYAVVSYYHDGVQIFDISNPAAPQRVAWYDTHTNHTNYNGFDGCWGVYPFLPSGTIIASDIENGLFCLRANFPFPNDLTITTLISGNLTCFGDSGAGAWALPSGGTGPYTYLWSTGDTLSSVSNLSGGQHTVTVFDRYGNATTDTIIIAQPQQIGATYQVTAESCPGTSDGAIDMTVSGGTPGYSYQWSTGDQVEDISSLSTGTYFVTVT